MSVITGPWLKEPSPAPENLMPPSGLVDRASIKRLEKELRGLAKLETTPPYHQDDVLYAIEKATKIRYCYVVKGSEWTAGAMERAAWLNLGNFMCSRRNKVVIGARDQVQVMDEVDLQLYHVPHMVPAKQRRKTYAEYFGY